ncbi:hypothetical protein PYJP_03010 [Pyrofollis japonicus]|uniref:hypothetical protein n=1 Tax=Pyrofollis japonicus TaxID=3060460 RepID=UPI00295ADF1E|nr:hypothetical protein [Pyrofollis japonicus]BEP16949.1 hypothetical protein PYJP_03010 [Pyrofollis japonicus]
MRGIEGAIGGLILGLLLLGFIAILYSEMNKAMLVGREITRIAYKAKPRKIVLEPLAANCIGDVLPVKLLASGFSGYGAHVLVYDINGSLYTENTLINDSATIRIPCSKNVVIVLVSDEFFQLYSFDYDPTKPCLSGFLVNGSALLGGNYCLEETYSSPEFLGLQPVWVRGIISNNEEADYVLTLYGALPCLVINMSETSATPLGTRPAYIFHYAPGLLNITAYKGRDDVFIYPKYCKPGIGCYYVERRGDFFNKLVDVIQLEYEDAELSIARPGWLYLRDYRAIVNYPYYGHFMALNRYYYTFIESNITKMFFTFHAWEEERDRSGFLVWKTELFPSLRKIVSVRTIDAILIPLLVSKYSKPLTISFAVLPASYSISGEKYELTIFGDKFIYGKYGPYSIPSFNVGLHLFLVPLTELRLTGIPVPIELSGFVQCSGAAPAVYHEVLVPRTPISPNAPYILSRLVTIDPGTIFKYADLVDEKAILVLEIVLDTKDYTVPIDTADSCFGSGDIKTCPFGGLGVALIGGLEAYIHLSILPGIAYKADSSYLLLVTNETTSASSAIGVEKVLPPSSLNTQLKLAKPGSYAIASYNIDFEAEAGPIMCKGCKIVPMYKDYVVIKGGTVLAGTRGTVGLDACSSAESLVERVLRLGPKALTEIS